MSPNAKKISEIFGAFKLILVDLKLLTKILIKENSLFSSLLQNGQICPISLGPTQPHVTQHWSMSHSISLAFLFFPSWVVGLLALFAPPNIKLARGPA